MYHRKAFQRYFWIVLCLWALLTFRPITAQEIKTPRFGKGVGIITFPEDGRVAYPSLSPGGDYAIAHTALYYGKEWVEQGGMFIESDQYLFDLREFTPEGQVIDLQPIASIAIDEDDDARPVFAFSSDEHYLAVKTATHLQIFTLPELELVSSLAVGEADHDGLPSLLVLGSAAWGDDDSFVAATFGSDLYLWQVDLGTVYHYDLERPYNYQIVNLDHNWLLLEFDRALRNGNLFVCSFHLENCHMVDVEDLMVDEVTTDGEFLITKPRRVVGGEITVWKRVSDLAYQIGYKLNPDDFDCSYVMNVSPNSRYLGLACNNFRVYDLVAKKLMPVVTDVDYSLPRWFPNGEYFLVLEGFRDGNLTLALYDVNQSEPIDTLTLFSIPEVKQMLENKMYLSDRISIQNINVNGQRALVNLGGWMSLIIPIKYE